MGEMLKFVTSVEISEKKTPKNFCAVCKNDSILKPFYIKFRFERPILSSAKRA